MGDELYKGIARFGFEVSAFEPADSGEKWWLIPDGDAYEELRRSYDELAEEPYQGIHAEIRGEVSVRGRYGHLNSYDRTIRMTEFVCVRKGSDGNGG